MIIPVCFLFLVVVSSLKISANNSLLALSVAQTQAIKGIFVVTIFFSHFCSYVSFYRWYDIPMDTYCHWLGQLMVVPFLFYSGYGIFESVKKKGEQYVRSFPQKRILKTLIHFDLAVFLFIIYNIFFVPDEVSILKIVFSLIAWESIGNSNWFIFAILCAYVFSFVSLHFCKGNLVKSLILIMFFSLCYIAVLSKLKDGYWFDTILAFPLGCFFSLGKEKFMSMAGWTNLCLCLLCLVLFVIAKNNFIPSTFVNVQLSMIGFMMLVVFLSKKVKFESKILSWLGSQVFGVYILQRLPMNFGKYMHWNEQNIYLFFLFCFVITIALSVCFHKATNWIDSRFLGDNGK